MSRLLAIAIKEKKRAPMLALNHAEVTSEKGVAFDFRGKPGKRQVTVLSAHAWQKACDELATSLDWTTRRANILVDELALHESTGKIIKIADVELLITGETDPCERMEQAVPGLSSALAKDWRGGVCCRVLKPGKIRLNDEVQLLG